MAAHPYISTAIAIAAVTSAIVVAVRNIKTTEEKIADLNEKFNEISENIKTVSSEFQNLKKSTDSIIPRFAELSKGVDRFGYHSLMFLSNIITKASTQHSDSLCSVQALFFAVIAASIMLTVLLTIDFNAQISKLSIVSKGQLFKLILQGFTQDSILSMVPADLYTHCKSAAFRFDGSNPSSPTTKSPTPFGVGLFVLRADSKGRSKQTVRWTVCPAVAFPQKSESVLHNR